MAKQGDEMQREDFDQLWEVLERFEKSGRVAGPEDILWMFGGFAISMALARGMGPHVILASFAHMLQEAYKRAIQLQTDIALGNVTLTENFNDPKQ